MAAAHYGPREPASRLRMAIGAIRLIHPFPASVVVLASALLIIIAGGRLPPAGLLARATLVVFLSQIAVGALNDFVDRADDAVTQGEKPIPSGDVPAGLALAMTTGSVLLFVPLASTFGTVPFLLAAFGTASGVVYDLWLKPTPVSFLGYIGGFLSLLTWVWVITGQMTARLALLYLPAAALVVAAHLAQSYPDIESDRRLGKSGLAATLGPARTLATIVVIYSVLAAGSGLVALATRTDAALIPICISVPLAALAVAVGRRRASRTARQAVFQLIAPALTLLGLAALIVLSRWR